jgi:3-oxoacyl-[acyl-carrier protein] reductase
MQEPRIMLITGTRKGIGRYLAEYYLKSGWTVVGCSRKACDLVDSNYQHHCLDVADESRVRKLFIEINRTFGKLDALLNNAAVASMNHVLLTPMSTTQNVINTNFIGTFLFCREAAKLMQSKQHGRIINFTTVATPLNLEGEAVYAASKAAVESLTRILARELADCNITVNAIGPTAVATDMVRSVPQPKMEALLTRQAFHRYGEMRDISHLTDFFLHEHSDFITGQIVYLGGV